MQTFLFFTPENDVLYGTEDICNVLEQCPGFAWDGHWQQGYRSGFWADVYTHARCSVDVGQADFNHDDAHNETTYDGWQLNPIQVKIPLSSPHWHCVESLRFVETMLSQLPHMFILDTEDTASPEVEGPAPLDRMRALASWEQLHLSQTEGVSDYHRMERVNSIALWRYRRAIGEGNKEWPQALVLLDKDVARSAVIWDEPEEEIIVPPVELAVLKTDYNTSVISVEELISRAAHVNNLDCAGAVKIPIGEDFKSVIAQCVKMDVSRFKFLTDDEWSD